jgi:hypothetical protein
MGIPKQITREVLPALVGGRAGPAKTRRAQRQHARESTASDTREK